jgi:hypothetical protein
VAGAGARGEEEERLGREPPRRRRRTGAAADAAVEARRRARRGRGGDERLQRRHEVAPTPAGSGGLEAISGGAGGQGEEDTDREIQGGLGTWDHCGVRAEESIFVIL